jgi:hypothetical protein
MSGSREVVITVLTSGKQFGPHEIITPVSGCSLIIIGNYLHLGSDLSCEALLFLGVVSVPCHKDVISQSCHSLYDCRQETQQRKQMQNGGRDIRFLSCFQLTCGPK